MRGPGGRLGSGAPHQRAAPVPPRRRPLAARTRMPSQGYLAQTPHTNTNAGISSKTQELYALVFICRYLDLFTNYVSL